jgi:hypothetical protein
LPSDTYQHLITLSQDILVSYAGQVECAEVHCAAQRCICSFVNQRISR